MHDDLSCDVLPRFNSLHEVSRIEASQVKSRVFSNMKCILISFQSEFQAVKIDELYLSRFIRTSLTVTMHS